MNRGNIPGYYFDEQKKKYFKIQADHLVPHDAKYANGKVKAERRSQKKRKTENSLQLRRESQTIKQCPVLRSPITGGIGLTREHGISETKSGYVASADYALVSQMRPEAVYAKGPKTDDRLQDAYYIPEMEQMVMATTSTTCGKSVLLATQWQWSARPRGELDEGLAAFNSSISSIATYTLSGISRVVACASQFQVGNVAFTTLPPDIDGEHKPRPIYHVTLGQHGSSIGDSSIHGLTGNLAVIGSSGILVLDQDANRRGWLQAPLASDWPFCEPCINWLDTSTLTYGEKAERGYNVMLWDIRNDDARVARFHVKERLTGVFNPAKYGQWRTGDEHQIFASTNRRIDLFDTRMPNDRLSSVPVRSFPHVHGGPRLQRAAYGDLVAAVDSDNIIQTYSVRNGMKIGSMSAPTWKHRRFESPSFRQLRWYDDPYRGPSLQAVRGHSIIRWTWRGHADSDDDLE